MKFLLVLCFVVLVSNAAAVQDLSGKIFIFPQETATDHVRLTLDQQSFTALTVCHRFFTDLTRGHVLFSLATPTQNNAFLSYMYKKEQALGAFVLGTRVNFAGVDCKPNTWHSVCTTWDSASGLGQAWLNWQPLTPKYISETPITGKPVITLGQEQDSHGGSFTAAESFVGMMTDLHMWNYKLSTLEIQRFMQSLSFTPGNVLNWAALDFEIRGRVMVEDKQNFS